MITITIWGEPHPQGRPRATRKGAHASVYEATKDKKWKEDAQKQILTQLPIDESRPLFRSGIPLHVSLLFVFSCPKSDYRKKKQKPPRWHVKKMDPDNLAKIVLDSATKLVWADDAQVSMLTVGKIIGRQGDAPRTIMMVKEIDHDPVTLWRSKWESQ